MPPRTQYARSGDVSIAYQPGYQHQVRAPRVRCPLCTTTPTTTPTLSGATPGPGQGYLQQGYYRPKTLPDGRTDTSVAMVIHDAARMGDTRAAVEMPELVRRASTFPSLSDQSSTGALTDCLIEAGLDDPPVPEG
jgi:hypothetical protein